MAKSKSKKKSTKEAAKVEYDIELTTKAEKEVIALSDSDYERIEHAIDSLITNPRPTGVIKLKGRKNEWRIRVGRYRILYAVDDAKRYILVFRVTDRKEAYRKK